MDANLVQKLLIREINYANGEVLTREIGNLESAIIELINAGTHAVDVSRFFSSSVEEDQQIAVSVSRVVTDEVEQKTSEQKVERSGKMDDLLRQCERE